MVRVEHAYARHIAARQGGGFTTTDGRGRFMALPRVGVAEWLADPAAPAPLPEGPWRPPAGALVSQIAHQGLHRGRALATLRRQGVRFLPAVHDLIPLELPDTTRWLQRRMQRLRMANVGRLADGVLVFSQAVQASLASWLAGRGMAMPPSLVAPLGLDLPTSVATPGPPYFLCIATIEKRKNHALLLEAWRRLGPRAPPLVLVGRRSFGATQALRLLPALPMVEERGHCSDAELAALLAGARALLMPSQAEGFGLPVAEALAAGTPVIASQALALREVGGGVPEHLPADDPGAWAAMVAAYLPADSTPRAAQLARLAAWRAPGWDAHFAAVERFAESLASRSI